MTKRQGWTVGKTLFISDAGKSGQLCKNEIRTFSDTIDKSILEMHERLTWKVLEEDIG